MSVLLWIIVGVIAAIIVNSLRGHNTLLNTTAALAGSIGSGFTYILTTLSANDSVFDALASTNWNSFWVAVIGAVVFSTVAQLYTLESKEYNTEPDSDYKTH